MIVYSRRVVLPDGETPAALHVHDGRIAAIHRRATAPADADLIDAADFVVLPGLVDTHVHINDPGRAHWEGFETATRAAAAGGVTTLVDMPLNSVPATTTAAALAEKRAAAAGRCHVDVTFWGGVVPGNPGELEALARAGVRGFKCFLSPSGVEEFAHVGERDLRAALPVLARLHLPLLVHAELPSLLREPRGDPRRYHTWCDSRPPDAEVAAIDLVLRLAAEFGARVHIVHLATSAALPLLRAARNRGTAVTVETCPHYLMFAAEEIRDGETQFKCAPPIRSADERERLGAALLAGDIDFVATDHSPAPPELKHLDSGDFVQAWGGIASLQIGLAATWSASAPRAATPSMLARWLAHSPARLAALTPAKGAITVGADADLVIWDPDGETRVNGESLYHRHAVTPYHDRRLRGRVRTTILRGAVVFDADECRGAPTGRVL